jgi:hypothetical protein
MKRALIFLFTVFSIAFVFGCDGSGQDNGGCNGGGNECAELVPYERFQVPQNDTPFTGPYEVVIEGDPDFPTHTIFRPVGAAKMPILSWGEGGCVKMGRSYSEMMSEIASYGILVIADGGPKVADMFGGNGGTTPGSMVNPVGDALIQGIDYAFEKNNDPCSPLYKKVDTSKVAVSGQSCGGLLALAAAADPRVTVTFIMSSGLFNEEARKEKLPKIHTPVIYLNGGSTDVAFAQATLDIKMLDELNTVPTYWVNSGIGHMADILTDNGGTFGKLLADWLRYQFFGDEACAALFVGDACGYCQDNDPDSVPWTMQKYNDAP